MVFNQKMDKISNDYINEELGKTIHNVTIIHGGTQINSIPNKAIAQGNIRTIPEFDNGKVIAHMFTIVEDVSAPRVPQKTLFVDDLCVDEAARGQKIGEKLYQFALKYAKEIGCYNLTLNVWSANKSAVRFYERQGMTPQETRMEQIID